jgi:hypothetical protein
MNPSGNACNSPAPSGNWAWRTPRRKLAGKTRGLTTGLVVLGDLDVAGQDDYEAMVGDDGIERLTTQAVFDILEIPQRSRGAGACRRLAKLMAELGWSAVRVRGMTRGGYLEQVRGYCRDARQERH